MTPAIRFRVGLGLCVLVLAMSGCSSKKERELTEQAEKSRDEAAAALNAAASARGEIERLNECIQDLERKAKEAATALATVTSERTEVRQVLDELRDKQGRVEVAHADVVKRAADDAMRVAETIANLEAENQHLKALVAKAVPAGAPRSTVTSSVPDERKVSEQMGELAASQSNGVITLLGFNKTDGKNGVRDGVETYVMEYVAEVRFGAACRWLGMGFGPGALEFKVAVPPARMNAMDEMLYYSTNPGPSMRRGDKVRIKGELYFDRSERGWRLRRVWQTSMEKA